MASPAPIVRLPWPPGLTKAAIDHCPRAFRNDAFQAAWLAVSEGRKPDSAVRALLRHEQKHESSRITTPLQATAKIRHQF